MTSPIGKLGGIAAGATGEAVAFGLGFALGRALDPIGTEISQDAWTLAPIKAPGAELLAEGVAQGQVDEAQAKAWARQHGYGDEQWAALVNIANTGPAVGEAFRAWRRGLLTDAQFDTALHRTGLETEWNAALRGLKDDLLEPGALATAIHRGIVAGGGLLVTEPPSRAGRIPQVPQSELDPIREAAGLGVTPERLRIMVGNTGLPLSLGQMLQLLNRGQVTEDDVRRSVAQSNVRNEYMEAALELRRHLLTPHEYVEARLRGWIDDSAMHAGAALSGMEPDDADLMAKLSGRPLSFRQAFIGRQRGADYDGPTADIDPAFLSSLRQSNVRPEWYALAWAQRYNYPSPFVLRQLAAAGELSAAETEKVLLYVGWEPTFARKIAARWAGTAGAGGKEETRAELADEYEGGYLTEAELRASLAALGYTGAAQDREVHLSDARRVKRWREKVVDAIGAAYLAFKIDDTAARSELAEVNVTGDAANLLLGLWGKQRRFAIVDLTAAQVKRAFTHGIIDRPTALDALAHHHYTPADATTLLDE